MNKPQTRSTRPLLIFDMNETLLDLKELRRSVSNILGAEDAVSLWFETMLHYSLVDTVSEQYHNFGEIGIAALMMLASQRDLTLTKEEAQKVLEPIRSVPPFPEVAESLKKLKKETFRLTVLTNSSKNGMEAQLHNSGISSYFEQCLSVEEIGLYKPHRQVYKWAAKKLKVKPRECLFVAAHGWDIAGALSAGMQAAFIARPGHSLYPLSPEPDFVVEDLAELSVMLTG